VVFQYWVERVHQVSVKKCHSLLVSKKSWIFARGIVECVVHASARQSLERLATQMEGQ
jgi:hypothetical protein